jgi:hypothetical protein
MEKFRRHFWINRVSLFLLRQTIAAIQFQLTLK